LFLMLGERTLFSGEIGPARRILVEIPEGLANALAPITLVSDFRPAGFLDGDSIGIASLGWLPGSTAGRYGAPLLTRGEWRGAGMGRQVWPFLDEGWQPGNDGTAMMTGPVAELQFSPAMTSADAELLL